MPEVNWRFTTSCSDRSACSFLRSMFVVGRLSKVRNLESSEGIVPELFMMIICCRDGRTDEGEDNDIDGTRYSSNEIWDR